LNHGAVSHVNKSKRNFHIVELGGERYKLKVKRFGAWVYVRKNFRPVVFEDFSSVVCEVQRRKKLS